MEIATLNLTLGDAQRPLRYRKGSTDEGVIVRVLKHGGFNFGSLRRAKQLSDLYGRMVETGKTPLIVDVEAGIGASAVYFACSFPAAQVVALESNRDSFELLRANTAGLPVECLHAAVAPSGAPRSADGVTIDEIYGRNDQIALPFIAKLDLDRCEDLFAPDAKWIDHTPMVILKLSDCLIPGSTNLRSFVEWVADRPRDLVYLNDNVFSIDRSLAA
jgi:hypothetical protein